MPQKPQMCPHGTLGKKKCKRCRNANIDVEKKSITDAKRNSKNKMIVIAHYSNNTMQCALHYKYFAEDNVVKDIRCLTMDHVNGGGAELRQYSGYGKNGKFYMHSGSSLYRKLIREQFPDGFQVLCMNCQMIKAHENKEYRKRRKFYEGQNHYKGL